MIKRGILAFIFLVFISPVYAQECLPSGQFCEPQTNTCWDGTQQRRQTDMSDSNCWICSDWDVPCPPQTEQFCGDGVDDDLDNLIDCDDPDCDTDTLCIDKDVDNDGYDDVQYGGTDCDDNNVAVNPGISEMCNDVDDNCDQQVDEDLARKCGSTDVGECQYGFETCGSGTWGTCIGAIEPGDELCGNNRDDDCDGESDEGCTQNPPEQPLADPPTAPPEVPPESPPEEPLQQSPEEPEVPPAQPPNCIDNDADGYGINCIAPDCDDTNATVRPGAKEFCNNKDDNCNGKVDEQLTRPCGPLRRVGACRPGFATCIFGEWRNCNAVRPKDEVCDNRKDDDCDGLVDEGCALKTPKTRQKERIDRILEADNKRDIDYFKQKYKETRNYINIEGSSEVGEGITTINLRLVPIKHLKNLTIYHEIPKTIAESAKLIRFSIQPRIIEDDPLTAWQFANLDKPVDISYEIDKEVENAIDQVTVIPIAEESVPLESPIWMILLPIFIIPILGSIMVFFARAAAG